MCVMTSDVQLLSIGEFSRMTFLTVKTLRHYHETGLLAPARTDARPATATTDGAGGHRAADPPAARPRPARRRLRAVLAAPTRTPGTP